MTILTLQNISKEYTPGIPVLSDLNLRVSEGEMLALLGPSGSGKTTILRLIAGLSDPTDGDILFDTESVLSIPAEKRGATMVFQEHSIFPFMSVAENIAFGLKLKRYNRSEIATKVSEALALVQLSGFEDRRPAELSGGQRQRVALARALVVHPKILLLDEPLSNLETSLRENLRSMIRELQKELGITTVFVTHDQAEAVAVADQIALIIDGQLRQMGSPRSLFEHPKDADVSRFFGGRNLIKGTKIGHAVQTYFGILEVSHLNWPDGDVLLTIRPEAISIGANGYNNFPASLTSYDYRGITVQCKFKIAGHDIIVADHPHNRYSIGQTLMLHIPKERIHFLLPENAKEIV